MNIFVIPSWYPNRKKVTSGIFVKEQIEALGEYSPDVNQFISTWGHSMSDLSLRAPLSAISSIIWRCRQKRSVVRDKSYTVIFNPTLNWSEKFAFGGVSRLIRANKENFLTALDTCGKIDLIHAHACYPAGYIASIISKETGIPYVLTEHMGPFPFDNLLNNGVPNFYVQEAINKASIVVAVSPSLSKRIESFGFKTPLMIPNLVNDRLFTINRNKKRTEFVYLVGMHE